MAQGDGPDAAVDAPAGAAAAEGARRRAPAADARQRPWRRSDEVEAARLIVSQKKDLGAVAAGLDRSLGDVVCWYYREYKAQRAAVKARWPSAVAYAAMKAKRAAEDGDDDDARAEVDRPWGGLEEDGVADADDRAAPMSPRRKAKYLLCASSPRGGDDAPKRPLVAASPRPGSKRPRLEPCLLYTSPSPRDRG